MAAIDLRVITTHPAHYTATVATTWQEFKLAPWQKVTISAENGDIYIGWIGAETPAEGGAVGTHRKPLANGGSVEYVDHHSGDSGALIAGVTLNTSVFVASQAATCEITVTVERASK